MPEVRCICKICGKSFFAANNRVKAGTAKYCSRKCAGIGRKETMSGENHPNWKGAKIIEKCLICDKDFVTTKTRIKDGRGKYCSRECADIGRKTGKETKCLHCGEIFYSHLKSDKRFCSRKCYSEWLINENRKNLIKRPINPNIDGSTKQIELTKEKFAIVDSVYFDYLNQFEWHAFKSCNEYRAARRDGNKIILMSRDIVDAPKGKMVDHINHDTLDNRISNLRICNNAENQYNRSISKNSKSGYKGVTWHAKAGKWRVRVGKKEYGLFENVLEAAKEYDKQAKLLYGEFACLNFPTATVDDAAKDLSLSKTTINRYKPAGEFSES